ncbi:hypothetical protein ACFQ3N_13275 [Virgibacillus byunsanensis]|uniref:Uncharacterized protein n=1 Tax=Virgibacillus byunsanensis TaxID=570945 RepID=A0ABW3LPT6_9BACI
MFKNVIDVVLNDPIRDVTIVAIVVFIATFFYEQRLDWFQA